MRRIETLPTAFEQFQLVGGVLAFGVFDETEGTEPDILAAIPATLDKVYTFNPERLRELGSRRISEATFLGTWVDPNDGALTKIGHWKTSEGAELRDPRLDTTNGVTIVSGSFSIPDPGSGGQFAYAFQCPPYPLQSCPSEIQSMFHAIRTFILPPGVAADIRDWSSLQLAEASDYFVAGMEWWGVFLFSIHIPALQRLTIIAASTTD